MSKKKLSKKDEKLLNEIKNEVDGVIDANNSRQEKANNAEESVNKIQKEIDKYKSKNNIKDNDSNEEMLIKRKITIKKTNRSKSFFAWLFNNNEL